MRYRYARSCKHTLSEMGVLAALSNAMLNPKNIYYCKANALNLSVLYLYWSFVGLTASNALSNDLDVYVDSNITFKHLTKANHHTGVFY